MSITFVSSSHSFSSSIIIPSSKDSFSPIREVKVLHIKGSLVLFSCVDESMKPSVCLHARLNFDSYPIKAVRWFFQTSLKLTQINVCDNAMYMSVCGFVYVCNLITDECVLNVLSFQRWQRFSCVLPRRPIRSSPQRYVEIHSSGDKHGFKAVIPK